MADATDDLNVTDDFDPTTHPDCTPFGIPLGSVPMGTLARVAGVERARRAFERLVRRSPSAAPEPPGRDAGGSESQVAPGLPADGERSAPPASSDACNFGTHNHESIVDVKDGRLWCFTHQRPCPYPPSPFAASADGGKVDG